MKNLIIVLALSLSVTAFCDKTDNLEQARPKVNPVLRKTGGFIERPGVKAGLISLLNGQTVVEKSAINEISEKLAKLVRVKVDVKDSKISCTRSNFKKAFIADGANYAIFLVADNKCEETIGVFPDQKYAFVNVSALDEMSPGPAFLKARTQKEIARAFLYLTGGASSQSDNNVMSPLATVQDLDKIANDSIPMDVVARVYKYLPRSGCNVYTRVPYILAVREGWAPAPTNDVQKAIWDKVRSIPTNPMKIKYQPKK